MVQVKLTTTEQDDEVFALIRKQHPLTCVTDAAVMRKALEHYLFTMGPNRRGSKSAQIGEVKAIAVAHARMAGVDVEEVIGEYRNLLNQQAAALLGGENDQTP